MTELDLKGIFPQIPTPFVDGEVSYDKLALNVEKWSGTGIKGFVVLGSNGENVFLSEGEKREVVKTVIRSAARDMLINVGSGCESTKETIRLTRDCAEMGAHAALVVTPCFYGAKMNADALINHYSVVADNIPIPVMPYNVPKFTHINLTAEVISRLSEHPNIRGVKDSSGNIALLGEFLNRTDDTFDVLVGTAGPLFGGLTLGSPGGILALANVTPENCVRIYQWVKEGLFDRAKDLQLKMIPVNQAITATYGIAGLKAAMDMVGYFGVELRLPLLPLSEKEKSELRTILSMARLC